MRTLLRVCVSVGLIAVVLSRAELAEVGRLMAEASMPLLAVAFMSYFVGYLASVARWSTLLAAHEVRPGFGYLYSSFMIGMFFNQLLPTTVGGDVARYHYTSGASRAAAFSAVIMDRIFGMVALMMFALAGLMVAGRSGGMPLELAQAVAALLAVGLLAIGTIFMLPAAGFDRLRGLYRWLPAAVVALLDKMLGAFAAFRGRRDVVLAALAWSLLLQCVVIGHYYVVGLALGLTVPFYAYVFIVPLAIVVMMLPISINAIGVRESAFVYLLGLYDVAPSTGVAFSWLVYALILGHGLLGGLVFASVRRARG